MRESINYSMIPISQDGMDHIVNISNNVITHVSSNGYYGYQPKFKQSSENLSAHFHTKHHEGMDVQFNNCEMRENNRDMQIGENTNNTRREVNRKRRFEQMSVDDVWEFKKKRQNGRTADESPYSLSDCDEQMQTSHYPQKVMLHSRNPTHNIPDLPRCIMGRSKESNERKNDVSLEDILWQTHGISIYHWSNDQD